MEERSTAFFLHNTPNEVAAAPPVLAVAFSSLLTICLMMEQGRQVHQHFPVSHKGRSQPSFLTGREA